MKRKQYLVVLGVCLLFTAVLAAQTHVAYRASPLGLVDATIDGRGRVHRANGDVRDGHVARSRARHKKGRDGQDHGVSSVVGFSAS